MQKDESLSFLCSTHPDEKIIFICAANDWHFQPLCQLCTPGHTQNHAKRLKINLESIEHIQKKNQLQKPLVCQKYQQQIQKVSQILKKCSTEESYLGKQLRQVQQKVILKIRTFFSQLNQKVLQKQKTLYEQNAAKLTKLAQNLQKQVSCISDTQSHDLNFEQWRNSAKKIYFKQKLESYLEESAEIIGQFEQKTKALKPESRKGQFFQNQNQFFDSLVGLLRSQIQVALKLKDLDSSAKQTSSAKTTLTSKQASRKVPIIKPKRKQCKNCNQQMEYLTENKKHLICKFCNFKERNYVKKPL